MKMTPQRANGRKQAARLKAQIRRQRMLNVLKRRDEPDNVLRALAMLGLPKDRRAYDICLRALCDAVSASQFVTGVADDDAGIPR